MKTTKIFHLFGHFIAMRSDIRRLASKSLAIRRYIERIDFSKPFEEQEVALKIAFDAAKDLQDLIKVLKIRNNV